MQCIITCMLKHANPSKIHVKPCKPSNMHVNPCEPSECANHYTEDKLHRWIRERPFQHQSWKGWLVIVISTLSLTVHQFPYKRIKIISERFSVPLSRFTMNVEVSQNVEVCLVVSLTMEQRVNGQAGRSISASWVRWSGPGGHPWVI